MSPKPELIAGLQVGASASGECSVCHEVIIVKGDVSQPEQLSEMLRDAFEEHVRGADISNIDLADVDLGNAGRAEMELSKKVMIASGNLD